MDEVRRVGACPVGGKRVVIRRLEPLLSIAAQITPPQVIGQDEHHIGARLLRRPRGTPARRQRRRPGPHRSGNDSLIHTSRKSRGLLEDRLQQRVDVLEDGDEAQAAIQDAFQGAWMNVTDSLYEEIHLGTGWPIDYTFTRETFIEVDGQQQRQLIETNIRIIIED